MTSDLTTIATLFDPIEVEVVRSLLESNGLKVFVNRREALGGIYGLTIDGLAKTEIQVLSLEADVARALLKTD